MSRLERTAYFCLIALCLLSGGVLIRNQWFQKPPIVQLNPESKSLIGKQLNVPGANWSGSGMSAVLFLSTQCHFCEASMPFYRKLAETHHQESNKGVALLAISREPAPTMEDHLARNDVKLDHVYQVASNFDQLRGTPTLMFVDRDGIIRRVFIGQLNADQEKQVLDSVQSGELL